MEPGMASMMLVALGGALGGMGRLGLGNAVGRRLGTVFPWGTLAVNLSGAFAMGGLAAVLGLPATNGTSPAWQGLAVGLLGGYTTVSSFSLQTLSLWQGGRHRAALGNVVMTLVAGFVALVLGWWLAGWWSGGTA